MLTEILTGMFGAATMGYLMARHNHMKKVEAVEKGASITTISKEARDRQQEQQEEGEHDSEATDR